MSTFKQSIHWWLALSLALSLFFGITGSALAADFRSGETITIGKNEVINDDLLIGAHTVIIDGVINGDLLVGSSKLVLNGTVNGSLLATGQSLTINGTVNGTLYAASAAISLGPNARIERNLFFGGYSLIAKPGSVVKRDLSVGSYQAILEGEVARDLRAGVGALEVKGVIGGDAYVDVESPNTAMQPDFWRAFVQEEMPATIQPGLRVSNDARIVGTFNYISPVEQTSGIQMQPTGGVVYSTPVPNQTNQTAQTITTFAPVTRQDQVLNWLWSRLRELVSLLVLGALALWLLPQTFFKVSDEVKHLPLPAAGWGFVVSIIGYAGAILFLVLLILMVAGLGRLTLSGLAASTFFAGFGGLSAFFIAFTLLVAYGSKLVVLYPLGQWLLGQLSPSAAESKAWSLLLSVFVYVLVVGIPYLGAVVGLVVTLIGLGAMWLAFRDRPTPAAITPKMALSPA